MHKLVDGNSNKNVVHRTLNLYCPDRFIYLFSDASHLVKTSRNCLYNSEHGLSTRNMWNNGHCLVWRHIMQLYYEDLENELRLLPKITSDHILTSVFCYESKPGCPSSQLNNGCSSTKLWFSTMCWWCKVL